MAQKTGCRPRHRTGGEVRGDGIASGERHAANPGIHATARPVINKGRSGTRACGARLSEDLRAKNPAGPAYWRRRVRRRRRGRSHPGAQGSESRCSGRQPGFATLAGRVCPDWKRERRQNRFRRRVLPRRRLRRRVAGRRGPATSAASTVIAVTVIVVCSTRCTGPEPVAA